MSIRLFQIDAFTDKAFAGNPAAVCLLETTPPDRWLQNVAAEMNLSETAFLLQEEDDWRLRWFTPRVEVKLCGHATLAAAHFLWEAGLLSIDQPARFRTLSGLLTAKRNGEWIEMDFPSQPPIRADVPVSLAQALGVEPVGVYDAGWTHLVEVANETTLRGMAPDFPAMRPPFGSAIITSRSDRSEYDCVCRFFAPAIGIDEDPVTGSAHCVLAPFWSQRLGKTDLVSYQASSRGGLVRMRPEGDRVKLSGQAVTVLKADLVDHSEDNARDRKVQRLS
jgi:PhzF family phenazine biosynthesis protein